MGGISTVTLGWLGAATPCASERPTSTPVASRTTVVRVKELDTPAEATTVIVGATLALARMRAASMAPSTVEGT